MPDVLVFILGFAFAVVTFCLFADVNPAAGVFTLFLTVFLFSWLIIAVRTPYGDMDTVEYKLYENEKFVYIIRDKSVVNINSYCGRNIKDIEKYIVEISKAKSQWCFGIYFTGTHENYKLKKHEKENNECIKLQSK